MTRTIYTNSHWSCPSFMARASTGTWATVDTCKRRTGLGLDWNFFAVAFIVRLLFVLGDYWLLQNMLYML